MRRLLILASGLLLAASFAASTLAADLQRTHFKIIGFHGSTMTYWHDIEPFWKEMAKKTGGMITADVTPVDQLGLDDFSLLRLLKLGVMDIVYIDVSKMAGDDPRLEGGDLAGLSLTIDQARAVTDAWAPIIDGIVQKSWNGKLLTTNSQPTVRYL